MDKFNALMNSVNHLKFLDKSNEFYAVRFLLFYLYRFCPSVFIHSIRVSGIFYIVSSLFQKAEMNMKENLVGAALHDIGKISISYEILYKPSVFDETEWAVMKNHSVYGRSIVEQFYKKEIITQLVELHHEQWDGKGYPYQLSGEEIPFSCRLLSICDAIDAMTSERVYKSKMSNEECLAELIRKSGTQFDPELIKIIEPAFIHIFGGLDDTKESPIPITFNTQILNCTFLGKIRI